MTQVAEWLRRGLFLAAAAMTLGAGALMAQEPTPETSRELRAVMLDLVFSGITAVGGEIGPQSAHEVVSAINDAVVQVESDGMPLEAVRTTLRNTRYFTAALLRESDMIEGRVSLGESSVFNARSAGGICPLYPFC